MIGLGCFDCLARDISDPETGEVYPALSCINDKTMADRCAVSCAEKVIWSIKASAQFNSDAAFLLREAFRSGRIRLLITEYDAEELLPDIRGYSALGASDKLKIQMPYINTTLLIDELTKLQYEENGGKVKIFEKQGMRKDRYSSLSYNYYVATQIEAKLNKKSSSTISPNDTFIVRAPKYSGKAVRGTSGRKNTPSWY